MKESQITAEQYNTRVYKHKGQLVKNKVEGKVYSVERGGIYTLWPLSKGAGGI